EDADIGGDVALNRQEESDLVPNSVAVGKVRDRAVLVQDLDYVRSVADHIGDRVFMIVELVIDVERWVIWLGSTLDFRASSIFFLVPQPMYHRYSIQLHKHPTLLVFSSQSSRVEVREVKLQEAGLVKRRDRHPLHTRVAVDRPGCSPSHPRMPEHLMKWFQV